MMSISETSTSLVVPHLRFWRYFCPNHKFIYLKEPTEVTSFLILMMKILPENLEPYKQTPDFTDLSVPSGLLQGHRTKAGVWGKIILIEGTLTYRILEPGVEEITLSTELDGVIEPSIKHGVIPQGGARFYVQFYRLADHRP
jgi:tellurite resistance-related uncharacterized protein